MKDESDDSIVIEGIDVGGHKFRPSDWAERIAANLASYDEGRRLCYSRDASPCTIQGTRCLIINRDMEKRNPEGYKFIMQFANDNHLRIQACHHTEKVELGSEKCA